MATQESGQRAESEGQDLHHEEDIVIVGGGIGGLTFAVALHRVGLKPVVLEQADRLRAWGTSISFWSNAMRILENLGMANLFRDMSINLLGREVFDQHGRSLTALTFADCEGGPHEFRVLERRVLMEALAGQLPPRTIRFNSKVTSITQSLTSIGVTNLKLHDGVIYSAKVVVGFDGVNSTIGSWMGLEKPKASGKLETRGMAVFPNGHTFQEKSYVYLGKGASIAFLPMTATKIYWFIVYGGGPEGWRNNMTPEQVKEEAISLTREFESPYPDLCINNTPLENFVKNTLRYRLNTRSSETQVIGTVTIAGDASHPTMPTLGQGGCMAMEDAIILTQKLYQVLKSQKFQDSKAPEHERIHGALLEFHRERHNRTYLLTLRAAQISLGGFEDLISALKAANDNTNKTNFMEFYGTLFNAGKLPIELAIEPSHVVT